MMTVMVLPGGQRIGLVAFLFFFFSVFHSLGSQLIVIFVCLSGVGGAAVDGVHGVAQGEAGILRERERECVNLPTCISDTPG